MAFTVVPIHNLNLPAGTVIPFGKFTIQDVPEWLLKEPILNELSEHDRQGIRDASQALVSEYYADSYGYPDPEWNGNNKKGIQDLRWQSALLANLSMWIVMPSNVCVTLGFHALTELGGRPLEGPVVNSIDRETTLFCHQRGCPNTLNRTHLLRGAALFETLSTVSRKNVVWPALRAFWAAVTSYAGDLRYPLYWQGLESLFGSDNETYGVSKRLRDRISYFLADNPQDQNDLHDRVKASYAVRSEIVHGRWEDSQDFHDIHMYTTEAIVRTVIRKMADTPVMLGAFLSPRRDEFLEAWVQSKSLTPPQFP
jgi:hypothetical protein